jgi:GMP synthase (glutamine-hydrolysing)
LFPGINAVPPTAGNSPENFMNGKKVLFIQHGEPDKAGLLGDVLAGAGVTVDVLRADLGQPVPLALDGYSGLALGGGGQGVYEKDKYPYLQQEIDLVKSAASAGAPVIGLCLGGQLMAAALGGEVRPAPRKEIGFFEVTLEEISAYDPLWRGLPRSFPATHWHGDVFEIPPGGMRLGSSALTPNQLFRYGHALYGFQFHLEMTPDLLDELVEDSREYLQDSGVNPETMRREGRECLPRLRETAETVFSRWAELL